LSFSHFLPFSRFISLYFPLFSQRITALAMAIDPSKVRAIALQKTVLLINNFISDTTSFLNMCELLFASFDFRLD
jgi:hypothetical protein